MTGQINLHVHEQTQSKMANMGTTFKTDLKDLEGRLAGRNRELETSLEDEIRRNGANLEDLDDRFRRSEEALRGAEEKIGEVQEEVRQADRQTGRQTDMFVSSRTALLTG